MLLANGDTIRFTAFNSATGVVLRMTGYLRHRDGSRTTLSETLTPTADRVATTLDVIPGEGFLESLIIQATAGSPVRGECYVSAVHFMGSAAAGVALGLIRQGYVQLGSLWSFPQVKSEDSISGHGAIRSITGTDPAAGVEISETVPAGALWRLITLLTILQADATVISRRPALHISDGSTVFFKSSNPGTFAANATGNVNWTAAGDESAVTILANRALLPNYLLLSAGFVITTVTANLQAADDWGAPQLLVEEWIQP